MRSFTFVLFFALVGCAEESVSFDEQSQLSPARCGDQEIVAPSVSVCWLLSESEYVPDTDMHLTLALADGTTRECREHRPADLALLCELGDADPEFFSFTLVPESPNKIRQMCSWTGQSDPSCQGTLDYLVDGQPVLPTFSHPPAAPWSYDTSGLFVRLAL